MENYAVGWGTLVLINTALANVDGRSPLLYFIGSLFFGPLITFILAVTKFDPEKGSVFVDLISGQNAVAKPVRRLPNWVAVAFLLGFIVFLLAAFSV